ncbi:lysozyme inhibitor LprI family protein [uncultured Novosphingobium sp.]|uniref:lysozyme inhibitor LprI family protein n=1 Tax=uncultured Novosphingobium sp. TaxID=292277 RepID=UPI00259780E5|nr:lysozyme inhibitor LprI family protein [uncultured Novosphingobium sp.]
MLLVVATAGCKMLSASNNPGDTCSAPSILKDLVGPDKDPEFNNPEFAKSWAEAKKRIGVDGLSKILVESFDPQTKRVECSASVNVADAPESAGISEDMAREILKANLGSSQAIEIGLVGGKLNVRVRYHISPLADGSGSLVGFDDPEVIGKLLFHLALFLNGPLEKHESSETPDGAAEDLQSTPEPLPPASDSATLDQVKEEYAAAEEALNSTWSALPAEQRGQLLTEQREWISSKGLPCRIEAANTTNDRPSFEMVELKCQTRMDRERTEELQSLMGQT